MSEEKKQRLKEYQKDYREAKKSQYNINYDLIVYAVIQSYIIKTLMFMSFRQTDRDKRLIMYD